MANDSELPTLKQHIALMLALLRAAPNKDFYDMYHLARLLVSNSNLHSINANDIFYFQCWKAKQPVNDASYYYDRIIHTSIGPRTMRWFVETQLIPMVELHIKISTNGSNMNPVTLESVENLL